MHRYNFTSTATVGRIVSDGGGNTQSTRTTIPGVSYKGYFSPTSPTDTVQVLDSIGQQYQFVTDGRNDIMTGDQLIINSIIYGVIGTAHYRQLSQDVLTCYLNLTTDNDGI